MRRRWSTTSVSSRARSASYPGTYSGVRRLNVFRVTGVSFRDDPIYESLYIGSKSWTEHDTLLGINVCTTVYHQLKQGFPEVVAVNALYQDGTTAIIAVKNRFAGFAKSVALRALGSLSRPDVPEEPHHGRCGHRPV